MIYIIDTMRKHNLVWGVGRGSSVASYVITYWVVPVDEAP